MTKYDPAGKIFPAVSEKKEEDMTPIDICSQCHKNGTSCCTARSGDENTMIIPPVSLPERKQILDFLGEKDLNQVFKRKPNTMFYIRQMQNLFPGMAETVLEQFPPDRFHWELKTEKNACGLLGPNGCILPQNIRPHFCRIYPFWFFGETPHIFQDADCLALSSYETIAEVFLSLGTTPERLQQIHGRICQDLELSPSRPQVELMSS